jgi:hypothetical protein
MFGSECRCYTVQPTRPMSQLFQQAPKIIREAARSPLGLLALVVLAVAVLAFLLFHDATELVRLAIFCALLLGAALFSAKTFQVISAQETSSKTAATTKRIANNRPSSVQPAVVVQDENDPPFEVDAIAIEDDTYHVLSANPEFEAVEGSLKKESAIAAKERPTKLGSVVVNAGRPLKFLAIIHDTSKDPTWTENSIRQALLNILREAEHRRLKAIAVPPLGTKHGSLRLERFFEMFKEVLSNAHCRYLEKVWFVVPERFSSSIQELQSQADA